MTASVLSPVVENIFHARLRHWTPEEFHRMTRGGIFSQGEPVEYVDGDICSYGTLRRWTRDEYYHLGTAMILRPDERTELLDGRIIDKVTVNPPHATAVSKTEAALKMAFGSDFLVVSQRPIDISINHNPEPDVAVYTGNLDDYSERHPTPAESLLVVEVSDSTWREDRGYKAGLYASADIREYWMVDLNNRTLEVRRQPVEGKYQRLEIFDEGESVAPLAGPNALVLVASLLPRPNTRSA